MSNILKVLVCGGGIGGPSVAYWLAQAGHQVTVVERYPALRASGAQIDLRAQGIEVVKRMGLLKKIRDKCVDEAGVAFVDSQNNVKATILANKSGQGAQSLTSEYEIMRGDLVRILYDATKDDVKYVFNLTVESFEQDDDGVTVSFSDGRSDRFDILIGADGQSSRVRRAILPPDSGDPFKRLGLYTAYWMVPRDETDSNVRRTYHAPRRWVMCRNHSPEESQAYFMLRDECEETRDIPRQSIEKQKQFWIDKFRGIGWQTDRFIQGMSTTENFYCQEIVQVRTDTWYQGRVVLLADAAHCPSPMTGMGTTSAFVGAYVLAGEIQRNSNDLKSAFANYDYTLRPFVTEIQKISPLFLRLAFPSTWFGVRILRLLASVVCWLGIPDLVARYSPENKGGWQLPNYQGLEQSFLSSAEEKQNIIGSEK